MPAVTTAPKINCGPIESSISPATIYRIVFIPISSFRFCSSKYAGALSYLSYGLQYIQEFLFTFLYMVNIYFGNAAIHKFAGN